MRQSILTRLSALEGAKETRLDDSFWTRSYKAGLLMRQTIPGSPDPEQARILAIAAFKARHGTLAEFISFQKGRRED